MPEPNAILRLDDHLARALNVSRAIVSSEHMY